jgi:ribosomal protein S18 acetylase RimI-like enzyme
MGVDVAAEHADRITALDPLIPIPPPLNPGVGTMLTTDQGTAIAWFQESGPGMASRTWEPDRRHTLEVRLAGDDRATVLADLLDQWATRIMAAVTPGDTEAAAIVEMPSRDTTAVSALIQRGFVPCSVIAVRKAGRPTPAGDPTVHIRQATLEDLDAATAMNMAVVHYDAPFGKVTPRDDSEEAVRGQLTFLLAQPEPKVWLAERDGRVVGLIHIQLPPTSNWANRYVATQATAYLACLGVTENERGGGVGSALTTHAHAIIDNAGLPVTLLHHALPNPRSTPFWYAAGYRPLWTTWMRRPVLR